MYCMVRSIKLFSKGEWIWCFSFKNLQACGYHNPPSVDTECFPWSLTKSEINLSATTNMFFLWIWLVREFACFYALLWPTARHILNQPLISVSSITNSETFFLLDDILWSLYFWIQFHTETWFRLIKQDSPSDTRLSDKWQAWKVQIQTMAYVLWRCSVSANHKGNRVFKL